MRAQQQVRLHRTYLSLIFVALNLQCAFAAVALCVDEIHLLESSTAFLRVMQRLEAHEKNCYFPRHCNKNARSQVQPISHSISDGTIFMLHSMRVKIRSSKLSTFNADKSFIILFTRIEVKKR
jgi:hypothetical protein